MLTHILLISYLLTFQKDTTSLEFVDAKGNQFCVVTQNEILRVSDVKLYNQVLLWLPKEKITLLANSQDSLLGGRLIIHTRTHAPFEVTIFERTSSLWPGGPHIMREGDGVTFSNDILMIHTFPLDQIVKEGWNADLPKKSLEEYEKKLKEFESVVSELMAEVKN